MAPDSHQPVESDTASARQRILDAAVEEFSTKGFGSVRIDAIAARANANKQLIYYYFSSKSGLYDAVLDVLVENSRSLWASMQAGDVEQMFRLRAEWAREGITWQRLLAWEGLEYWENRDSPIHRVDVRTASYQNQREVIERAQQSGAFPADIDPAFTALVLIFASISSAAFPQITKMVTGLEPDDPAVLDGVDRVLATLLSRAAGQGPSGPSQ
jgi:TetR/AcrR family transcriptional regulator